MTRLAACASCTPCWSSGDHDRGHLALKRRGAGDFHRKAEVGRVFDPTKIRIQQKFPSETSAFLLISAPRNGSTAKAVFSGVLLACALARSAAAEQKQPEQVASYTLSRDSTSTRTPPWVRHGALEDTADARSIDLAAPVLNAFKSDETLFLLSRFVRGPRWGARASLPHRHQASVDQELGIIAFAEARPAQPRRSGGPDRSRLKLPSSVEPVKA